MTSLAGRKRPDSFSDAPGEPPTIPLPWMLSIAPGNRVVDRVGSALGSTVSGGRFGSGRLLPSSFSPSTASILIFGSAPACWERGLLVRRPRVSSFRLHMYCGLPRHTKGQLRQWLDRLSKGSCRIAIWEFLGRQRRLVSTATGLCPRIVFSPVYWRRRRCTRMEQVAALSMDVNADAKGG